MYRETGEAADVLLMVRVPSPKKIDPTYETFLEKQGLELENESSPKAGLAIPVTVPDIWAVDAGAPAARVAHLVLDAWGLGPEEKLDLRLEGRGSWRAMRRMRQGHTV